MSKHKTIGSTNPNTNQPSFQITKNKNRQKVYNSDQVYLNDRDIFEIELFNPTTSLVLAKIKMNGKNISSTGIVLKPAQRVFLERYLDEDKKFVFSTYNISNTQESKDAIVDNGMIEISFYNEYVPFSGTITWVNYPNYHYSHNPVWNNYLHSNPYTFVGGIGITTSLTTNGNLTTATYNICDNSVTQAKTTKIIETGRVEKGEKSDQSFSYSNESFQSIAFHTQIIKLMPLSLKPITMGELRSYCSCGVRKRDSNWKFCPKCGKSI